MRPELKGFLFAVGAAFLGDCADIGSTILGNMHPQMVEGNPLVRDPFTHKAIIEKLFLVKGIFWGLGLVPSAAAIRLATKNWTLASAPFLWVAYNAFYVSASNMALLYSITH